ncbi:MAG: EAL domain-containing protein, partial [Thermoanaerobaculia bacterium]|nr:EAL domain-containing protein [Thermoanaerobaculia bacterium]
AMYRAKDLGRNHIQVCSQATSHEAIERMTLENDLRQAIDRGELELHYQPQVDAINSNVHALEALIRWNHPTRGLIMPTDFIHLTERSHLMVEIGHWVLREACEALSRWQDVDPPIRIAVNVSPRQFQDEHFLDHVKDSLSEYDLDPSQLELEITEGVAMQNPEAALQLLGQLKAMGVRISIDDFGTGYSSLSYLTKFPIDCLKIDQGFVQDIEKGGSESTIIAAVIALAHKLKLHVIAEGVETSTQLDFLVGQQCETLQGYFYSRPQPVEAIDALIRKKNI